VFGGVGEALFASLLSYLGYAWFFGEPVHSFAIHDAIEAVTVVYFLVVAIAVGSLAARLRRQLDVSRTAANQARMLYEFGRRTTSALSERDINEAIVSFVSRVVSSPVALVEAVSGEDLSIAAAEPALAEIAPGLREAASWSLRNGEQSGWSTGVRPELDWLVIPLTSDEPAMALAIARLKQQQALSTSEWQLLSTLLDQARVALDRTRLASRNAETQRYRETERLRSALLSSVSHDLRTPLASIVGAATTLQSLGDRLTPENRDSLADTIAGESRRLNRYIQNLLDMSRLDHGALRAEAEWIDLRDVVSAARSRLRDSYSGDRLDQSIPEEAAFVLADPALLEQILVNILDNAAKYGEGHVRIEAENRSGAVVLSVTDEGPGVPKFRRKRIFEPFNSADAGDRGAGGTGLGLSIARGFARAMGGDVLVRDAPSGRGARFEIVLPRIERPNLDLDEGGARAPTVDDDAA
jgi:two-component system sensor histidine kinase KdpD